VCLGRRFPYESRARPLLQIARPRRTDARAGASRAGVVLPSLPRPKGGALGAEGHGASRCQAQAAAGPREGSAAKDDAPRLLRIPRGDMPCPEPGRRRHALARAGPKETCPAQSPAEGGMPWTCLGQMTYALARAEPGETCLGQSRARGDAPWPEPDPTPLGQSQNQGRHALARAALGVPGPGPSQGFGPPGALLFYERKGRALGARSPSYLPPEGPRTGHGFGQGQRGKGGPLRPGVPKPGLGQSQNQGRHALARARYAKSRAPGAQMPEQAPPTGGAFWLAAKG
jgi:hypothetical protein